MIRLNASDHKLDFLFVLSLFTVFAAASLVLVLIGAKQYKLTADQMNYNYEVRTTSSYLTQKFRQYDTGGAVEITELEGINALALHTSYNDVDYTNYIYYYDGWLRELLVSNSSVYDLSAGEPVIEANGFEPSILSSTLIKVEITSMDNETYPIYVTLQSSGREAEQ